jgi:two-component system sporulation sensor kinase A
MKDRIMKRNIEILIVDDDPHLCDTLSDILEEEGYNIHTASQANEALKLIENKPLHGMLVDLKLADMDGISLLRRVKEAKPHIWVLIITGYSSIDSAIEALNQGAEGYLPKPLNINEVKASIMKAIEKQHLTEERDRYQEELTQAKKYLENIIENAGDGIMVIKAKEREIMSWNKAAEQITGYSYKEARGKNWLHFFPKEKRPDIRNLFKQILKGNTISNLDTEFISSSDKNLSILLTASPLKDARGKVEYITAIFKDISERKEWEKIFIHTAKMNTISQMAARIAHEIRNPLSSVHSAASLLIRDLKMSEEDKTLMKIIEKETMRIEQIISNFLRRCRPSQEKWEKINLTTILSEITTLMDKDKAISPKTKIEENLEQPAEIMADANMIHQLFWNLLLNSAEAMPQGGIITINGEKHTIDNKKFYRLAFRDDGVGIEKKDLNRLFEPFFSTKAKGSGLGLAVAKYIVDQHQGKIHVESEKGRGTTITLDFPSDRHIA